MNRKTSLVKLAFSLLITVFIVSCGGGSTSTNQPSSPPPTTANLTGMWEIHAVSKLVADSGAIIDVNLITTSANQYGDAAMGVYSYDDTTISIGGTCGEQASP